MSDGDERKHPSGESARRTGSASERLRARTKTTSAFKIPTRVDTLDDLILHRTKKPLGTDVRFLFVRGHT